MKPGQRMTDLGSSIACEGENVVLKLKATCIHKLSYLDTVIANLKIRLVNVGSWCPSNRKYIGQLEGVYNPLGCGTMLRWIL